MPADTPRDHDAWGWSRSVEDRARHADHLLPGDVRGVGDAVVGAAVGLPAGLAELADIERDQAAHHDRATPHEDAGVHAQERSAGAKDFVALAGDRHPAQADLRSERD